jgi:hypothetical protein
MGGCLSGCLAQAVAVTIAAVIINFFRPHESLKNKTPAEVARADFSFKSWQDVVMANKSKVQTCL